MVSYQQDLFKTLVDRLNFDSTVATKYFKNGELKRLIIHDRSKLWSFYISLDEIIPYQIFVHLISRLNQLFKHESIRLLIGVKKPHLTEDLIKDYWPWVVRHCGLSTIMLKQLVANSHLKFIDHHVSLSTKDEALRGFLVNGALVPIEDMYYQLGFPRFQIKVLGGKSNLPTDIVDFPIKKNANDIKLAKVAVKVLDNDSSKN